MAATSFDRSVWIRIGPDSLREVCGIRDADEVLLDWPQARRGEFYRRVRECVEAGKRGEASPGQVRELLVAFASHAEVLESRP